jgi:hypothetical protein
MYSVRPDTTWQAFVLYLQSEYDDVPTNIAEEDFSMFFSQLEDSVDFQGVIFPQWGSFANWRIIAQEVLRQL